MELGKGGRSRGWDDEGEWREAWCVYRWLSGLREWRSHFPIRCLHKSFPTVRCRKIRSSILKENCNASRGEPLPGATYFTVSSSLTSEPGKQLDLKSSQASTILLPALPEDNSPISMGYLRPTERLIYFSSIPKVFSSVPTRDWM